jgi:hypothetical protein
LQRAAREVRSGRLETFIDCRMDRNCHDEISSL